MKTGSDLPICHAEDRLMSVLVELSNKRSGCLLVLDEGGVLLGVFTDGDLRRTLQRFGPESLHEKIGNLMTSQPSTVGQHELIGDAFKKMQHDPKKWITVLPVIDQGHQKGRLLGLIQDARPGSGWGILTNYFFIRNILYILSFSFKN